MSAFQKTISGARVRLSPADRFKTQADVRAEVFLDLEIFEAQIRDIVLAALKDHPLRRAALVALILEACEGIDPLAAKLGLELLKAAGEIAQHGPNFFHPEKATGAAMGWPPVAVFPSTFDNFYVTFHDLAMESADRTVTKQELADALRASANSLSKWIARAIDEGLIERVKSKETRYRRCTHPETR